MPVRICRHFTYFVEMIWSYSVWYVAFQAVIIHFRFHQRCCQATGFVRAHCETLLSSIPAAPLWLPLSVIFLPQSLILLQDFPSTHSSLHHLLFSLSHSRSTSLLPFFPHRHCSVLAAVPLPWSDHNNGPPLSENIPGKRKAHLTVAWLDKRKHTVSSPEHFYILTVVHKNVKMFRWAVSHQ